VRTQNEFNIDTHPGAPRILFIGWAHSSHTHAWIDLMSGSQFNVHLFGLPDHFPPKNWEVKTYLPVSMSHSPTSVDYTALCHKFDTPYLHKILPLVPGMPGFGHDPLQDTSDWWPPTQAREYLSGVINSWQPDIIHTLGLNPASYFFYHTCIDHSLQYSGKWVVQARGGIDLELNRLQPNHKNKITAILDACDMFIADNRANYDNALELGINPAKILPFEPVPGTGGIDMGMAANIHQGPPSIRERLIIWPKAYECPQSKAMPVFEALSLIAEKIAPCRILMLASTLETRAWFAALPEKVRGISTISDRIPRTELLSLIGRSRVMLAPSILDGVPNSLLEAMALGAFPIVSPLKTITPIVREEKNVIFARNLYPQEIAQALIRAMQDDVMIDAAALRNQKLVNRLADRTKIKMTIFQYYNRLKSGTFLQD